MPPKKQLPTPSANTPAPPGTKRMQLLTNPVHYSEAGESLMNGRTTEFTVGPKKFSIHNTLSKANSPYIADLLKKAKKENATDISIPANSRLFSYFHNWLYEKDGLFSYKAHDWSRSETSLGYPYNALIKLYMLAHQLRVPSFANAVLQKVIEVRRATEQVCDSSTIALIYEEKLQSMAILSLFVDMVAFHVHRDNVLEWENLDFLKAVAHRLVVLRDESRQIPSQPMANVYFITDIADPEPELEPEGMEEDDDDDCVFISSKPAPNAGRTSRAPTLKRERSDSDAADVEA